MSSHYPSELDTDSVASSPRSEHDVLPRLRFMCSFGGKILPRPHDNQLRYVGGDTRIVAVHRHTTFSALINKLTKLSGTSKISVKYQLPNEDLDALISVSTDEDIENMMEEYDRVAQNQNPSSARLRLFLFNNASEDDDSRASSISSLLDGSANREQWFLDALNSGGGGGVGGASAAGIERGRSEASSMLSEVPDYLFGLDTPEETQPRDSRDLKPKIRREISVVSDPGSPAPVVSSPFGSTSSAPPIPELPLVKTKPENPNLVSNHNRNKTDGYSETPEQQVIQKMGRPGKGQYSPHQQYSGHVMPQVPVYYVPGLVQPGNSPVQPIPVQAQFVQQYPVQTGHHVPFAYQQPQLAPGTGQVYGGPLRTVPVPMESYDPSVNVIADRSNQKVYYGVQNPGMVHVYQPGMMVPGVEEQYRTDPDGNPGRSS